MKKKLSVKIVIWIFLLSFLSYPVSSKDKYIKFEIKFPYQSASIVGNVISCICDKNSFKKFSIFNLQDSYIKIPKYLKLPENTIDYLVNDTLFLYIQSRAFIHNDSLPKNLIAVPKVFNCDSIRIFPDTIFFGYQAEKILKAVFHNDSANVKIDWKMNEFEIVPFWYGDY